MCGNKCSLALFANQQIFCGEFIDSFTNGALAHAKAGGKIELAGYHVAGLPLGLLQALQNLRFDLLVQRTERWRTQATTAVSRA